MGNITASEVNKLRQMTGAGMMDCKKALTECEGDFEKAIDYLRKKGQKVAANRADKEAKEGMVWAQLSQDKSFACIVSLSCETDFVAKNDEFTGLVRQMAEKALATKAKTVEEVMALNLDGRTVADHITDLVGKIGEKMEVPAYAYLEAPAVFCYNHNGNKLATLVAFDKADAKPEVGHNVAMQVAAMNPIALSEKEVPADVIAREMEVAKEATRAEGKPENMIEKIAMGRMNKFYKENTLLHQEFIMDGKMSVADYVKANGAAAICDFRRVQLGA